MKAKCRCGYEFVLAPDMMDCRCPKCDTYYLVMANIIAATHIHFNEGMCMEMNCRKYGHVRYWHGSSYCEKHYSELVRTNLKTSGYPRTKWGWTKL